MALDPDKIVAYGPYTVTFTDAAGTTVDDGLLQLLLMQYL